MVAEGLTDSNGVRVFLISAPARIFVRIRRIGFSPYRSPWQVDADGGDLVRSVEVPFHAIVLPVVVVTASGKQCAATHDTGSIAALWDQAQTALRIVQLARDEQRVETQAELFERTLSTSDRLLSDHTLASGKAGPRPFAAADPALLQAQGFVKRDASGTTYFGPGVDYLLSPQFEETHCLSVVNSRDAQRGRVGIGFEPIRNRNVTDIRGTIWLDIATMRLMEVEFSYAGLSSDRALHGAGGYVEFQTLPSGAVFESGWLLRMPRWRANLLHPGDVELAGWTETGGAASLVPSVRSIKP